MFVFVSDVHLDEPHKERYGAFLRLMDKCLEAKEVEKVFLVGDIFDLWLGDRSVFIDKHHEAIKKITVLASQKEVHFFEGNHDFALGKFWTNRNVKVHKSFYEFEDADKKKWLVTHGDLLNTKDYGYKALRWFLRTWLAWVLIKLLPGSWLYKIGSLLSTTQKKEIEEKQYDQKAFDQNWEQWTKVLRKKKGFDYFVCGHYHCRTHKTFELDGKKFEALNLGAWLKSPFQYLSYSKDQVFKFEVVK